MKKRDVNLQNRLADFMSKNNMQMGVFVAHKIHWKEPNLASGNIEKSVFRWEISQSVEVAKSKCEMDDSCTKDI